MKVTFMATSKTPKSTPEDPFLLAIFFFFVQVLESHMYPQKSENPL